MSARVYSHSSLEAFAACKAKGLDSLRRRHGKVGPATQGQALHALAQLYLEHLVRSKTGSDVETGRTMWGGLKGQLTPEDEAGIAACCERFIEGNFDWLVASPRPPVIERRRYFTLDRREITEEVAHAVGAPVFAMTCDLDWFGAGPTSTDGVGDCDNMLDHKTHRVIEHVGAPKGNRQLLRYTAACFSHRQPVRGWLHFARQDYFESAIFTAEERDIAWRDLVVRPIMLAEAMLDRSLEPDFSVGEHCGDCDLRNGCDAARRFPFSVAPETATTAELLAAFRIGKGIQASLQKALKGRLDVVEAVADDGYEAVLEDGDRVVYERAWVEGVCGPFIDGKDLARAFKATKTSLTAVLKESGLPAKTYKPLLEECARGAEVQKVTTMKVRKVKDLRAAPAEEVDDG